MLLLPSDSYFLYVMCKFKVSWLCCLKIDYFIFVSYLFQP